MGFYGNISNVSRTQFQFDRIYPNRTQMDSSCGSDGVYPGRYVLVEYGSEETYFKSIFLYDGTPYANLSSLAYKENENVTDIYAPPAEGNHAYKVVDATYQAQNEADLFIYANEIVAVPVGRHIFDINQEAKYIKVANYQMGEFGSGSEQDYIQSQATLKTFLLQQYIIEDETDFDTKIYGTLADIYIINGTIIAPGYEALQELGYTVEDMVWRVKPGCEYSKNTHIQYFTIDTTGTTAVEGVFENPTFKLVSGSGADTFTNNFSIDKTHYQTSRGYDSTVWQKVYVEGEEKYVMVAELNTVVPTFDIVNDSPSLLPLSPHFDGNSTNVYYRLHWQPSWAIRMKAASPNLKGQKISQKGIFEEAASVKLTTDTVHYPSDQNIVWDGVFYNAATNDVSEKAYSPHYETWKTKTPGEDSRVYEMPAAIYYNKKGFNPEEISYSDFIIDQLDPGTTNPHYQGVIKDSNWQSQEDKIGFFPTGLSGHMYNDHNNSLEGSPQVDTQEFVCMLPSIGNAVASMWDMIYGGRNTNNTIKLSLKRNLEMGWEDGKILPTRKGLRLRSYTNGYQPKEVNTLVGAINSAHDLMGMIITPLDDEIEEIESNISALSEDKIYFLSTQNDYYRKQLQYEYEAITPQNGETAQDAYNRVKQEVFEAVDNLQDFDTAILKDAEGNYNPVYYQDYNNATDGDITKFDYIQETKYHPNRLYFELDENTIDTFSDQNSKLNVYNAESYFYHNAQDGKDELDLDMSTIAVTGRQYYEFDDYANQGYKDKFTNGYHSIQSIPTSYEDYSQYLEYDDATGALVSIPHLSGHIHGIYKPNTYYYRYEDDVTGDISYILDSSPSKTQQVYFTINADDPIVPDQNSYRELITYIPVTVTPGEDNPQVEEYYYFGENQAALLSLLSTEDFRRGQLKGATPIRVTGTFGDAAIAAYVFTEYKNGVATDYHFFKKVVQYVANTEPFYSISLDPILLVDYQPQAIFQPVFDEFTGKLIKIEFLPEDRIPKVVWKDLPDPNNPEDMVRTLVLEDPLSKEQYIDDNLLYIFGEIIAKEGQPASGMKLLGLKDINAKPNAYFLKQCQGTFYQGGMYHYHPTNLGDPLNQSYLLDTNTSGQYDESDFINYYKIGVEDIALKEGTYEITKEVKYIKGLDYVGKNYYYLSNGKYKPVVNEPAENTKLYQVKPLDNFYEPGKYYIQDAGDGTESTDNHYTLALESTMPSGATLYRKNGIYVTKDSKGVYPYGTEWNIDSDTVPEGVELSVRTDKYGLIKIPQLARTDNTMHGLILRINQILEAGNTGVRDNSTVQGALNRLNDLIARIDKMKSKEFVIVDEYGRMHSAAFTTAQAFNTKNEQKSHNENNSKTSAENRWISLEVDPAYNKPSFTLTHKHTPVEDTETTSDKNGEATISTANQGNNNNTTDILELYTWVTLLVKILKKLLYHIALNMLIQRV